MKTGVSYFHTRDPEHAGRDLDDMLDHGCNFVVHCFSELDMAFYNQAMEKIIRMTKDRDMEVYIDPWGLGGIFSGEAFSRFISMHLDTRQIDSEEVSMPAACPNHPKFREFQKKWINLVSDMGADVCFWDEPHFYTNFRDRNSWGKKWSCRCNICKRLYQEKFKSEMPIELTEEVQLFRQQSVLDFLEDICKESKRLKMRNCVCVLPDEGGKLSLAAGTNKWDDIVRIPTVDIFGTDPYWILFKREIDDYVRSACRRVIDLCDQHKKEAQAWALAFLIPDGREEEVGQAIDIIYETGIKNIAAWGYKACHFIDITCHNPEKVWDIIGKAFNKVRDLDQRN